MNHYCTFFDGGYLPQGLALWNSLQRHDPAPVCWVLALDDTTSGVLRAIASPGLNVLALEELLEADPALAAIRAGRPVAEFIFALKPCLCRFLLQRTKDLALLTYLDSDLYFFSSPAALFEELGNQRLLLSPHRYPSWHDDSAYYGRFNAGLVVLRPGPEALAAVEWWRARCLESCALSGDGRYYGDQKYLDEWPGRFAGLVVSAHPGVNVAPWNWSRHRFGLAATGVSVDGRPLVVFHFAQFRRINDRWWDSGQLEYGIMPLRLRSRLYGEYQGALEAAELSIVAVHPDWRPRRRGWAATLGSWRIALLRLFWGQCWRRMGNTWVAGRMGLGRFSGRFMGIYRRRRRAR